ncbi:unnamed protein product [marine sediment metagenome]|uniref:Uncharacterized protein n=1 Tax=marine sediment metagenome TaxID=412755 RepID=X1QR80_9ZZZZ
MSDLKMSLAICKDLCPICGEEEWLYLSDEGGLYCSDCLQAEENKESNYSNGND